jgi:tRNA C32,U32 (ribose-2'-O)-methylase TrmJ
VLEHIEYFEDKRPKELLMRRLRRFFGRAEPEKEEVAIFRGILRNIQPFKKYFFFLLLGVELTHD